MWEFLKTLPLEILRHGMLSNLLCSALLMLLIRVQPVRKPRLDTLLPGSGQAWNIPRLVMSGIPDKNHVALRNLHVGLGLVIALSTRLFEVLDALPVHWLRGWDSTGKGFGKQVNPQQ